MTTESITSMRLAERKAGLRKGIAIAQSLAGSTDDPKRRDMQLWVARNIGEYCDAITEADLDGP